MQYQLQRQAISSVQVTSPPPQIDAPEVQADARQRHCDQDYTRPKQKIHDRFDHLPPTVNLILLLLPHPALNGLKL
jgi:hypothetical protein